MLTDLHLDGNAGAGVWLTAPTGLLATGYLIVVGSGSRPWPRGRTASWLVGCLCLAVGTAGAEPVAAAVGEFAGHMISHLLVGMFAPLLLVMAAPTTLLLRNLPTPTARMLSRVASSRPIRFLTEPLVAASINLGTLWLLYTTDLYANVDHSPLWHGALHLHLLATGYLFTASIVSPDPLPHRRSYLHRGLVLVLALAAHDVLAKHLYAQPPAGVEQVDGELGAMIMYYGGDLVDLAMMIILCGRWYRESGRRLRRRPQRVLV